MEAEPEETEENRTKPNDSEQKATKDKRQITKDKEQITHNTEQRTQCTEQRTQNENQTTQDFYEKEGAYAPEKETAGRFRAPSLGEIEAYCEESGVRIDAEAFTDYYAARGWTVGAEPMRDWRAAVRNWQRRDRERSAQMPKTTGFPARTVQPPLREHHDDLERPERILAGLAADQTAKEGAS